MAVVYVDGDLIAAEDATVSVFDHGLLVGDGVFETLLLRRGRPFALRRHLDRLEGSAKGLGIGLPERTLIETAVEQVASALAEAPEARLRITVTSGAGPLGSKRDDTSVSLIVAADLLVAPAPAESVEVVPWPRNERGALAGLKTTSYGENVVALAWARERAAGEAIFGNTRDNLCEGTGSNVFVVQGGRLTTPPMSAGLLAGVTRDLVIDLMGCEEVDFPLASFTPDSLDEAFLTSTTRRVQPINSINGERLEGAPGPVTREAARRLNDLMAATDEP